MASWWPIIRHHDNIVSLLAGGGFSLNPAVLSDEDFHSEGKDYRQRLPHTRSPSNTHATAIVGTLLRNIALLSTPSIHGVAADISGNGRHRFESVAPKVGSTWCS